MCLKTLKTIEERFLQYYFIEIFFLNPQTKNHYKLPLLVHVTAKDEALLIQQNIIKAIIKENLTIEAVKSVRRIYPHNLERKKEEISTSQIINGYETINLLFERPDLESSDSKTDINYRVKINTIKKGEIPMRDAGNLFVFKIDKSILED